jgi:hypothetical protein
VIKWVDNIITGMNTPDVSGYAIADDKGVVGSLPIPEEFNNEIAKLLSRLTAEEEAVKKVAELKKEVERLKATALAKHKEAL